MNCHFESTRARGEIEHPVLRYESLRSHLGEYGDGLRAIGGLTDDRVHAGPRVRIGQRRPTMEIDGARRIDRCISGSACASVPALLFLIGPIGFGLDDRCRSIGSREQRKFDVAFIVDSQSRQRPHVDGAIDGRRGRGHRGERRQGDPYQVSANDLHQPPHQRPLLRLRRRLPGQDLDEVAVRRSRRANRQFAVPQRQDDEPVSYEWEFDPLLLSVVRDRRTFDVPRNPVAWSEREGDRLEAMIETVLFVPRALFERLPAERSSTHVHECHRHLPERAGFCADGLTRPHVERAGADWIGRDPETPFVHRSHEERGNSIPLRGLFGDRFQNLGGALIVAAHERVHSFGGA